MRRFIFLKSHNAPNDNAPNAFEAIRTLNFGAETSKFRSPTDNTLPL